MSVNVQGVIRGIMQAGEVAQSSGGQSARKPVVTISRSMGSGGNEIGEALADRLGVECYYREILDAVAESAEVDKELIMNLHEKVSRNSDSWLYALVFGKNVTKDDYLHRLVTIVRGLYWKGGVIMGRGGNVILTGRDILRVRITGSVDACATRIAHHEGIDLAEARQRVRESNKKREQFMWNMFRVRANDPLYYDLVINTDHFPTYAHITDIIMDAVRALGLDRPASGTTNR